MTSRKNFPFPSLLPLLVAATMVLTACDSNDPPTPIAADSGGESGGQAGEGDSGDSGSAAVMFLEQGFSADDRQAFYYLSQGSQLLPYAWFLALEQVDSQLLFRDDAHMRELGYIPQSADPRKNPDGLPIGLTRDDNPDTVDSYQIKKAFLGADYKRADYPTTNAWMGPTCAACHTAQIEYQGQSIRIDGGAALVDHQTFMTRLATALESTHQDSGKMERFARKVLTPNWSQGEQDALAARVVAYSQVLNRLVQQNATELAYGHGRLDAFGAILNRVLETGLGIPGNHAESNAPVSLPFLWTAPQLDWVQWNSAVSDAIARNTGEVMGVYAHLQLSGTPQSGQFNSTVRVDNLDRIEGYVEKLEAPAWPEQVFGPLDRALVDQGERLYATNCKGCHVIRDANGEFPRRPAQEGELKQFVITNAPSLAKLGTDPRMVQNVLTRFVDPGDLAPHLPPLPEHLKRDGKVPGVIALGVAVSGVIDRQLRQEGLAGDALAEVKLRLSGGRITAGQLRPSPEIIKTYKARPLNGIWAAAPYLHNGSVPSLAQLLLPEDQRVARFKVGSREFDPVNVGYATDTGFTFDTTLDGNRNTGHSGPEHTQAEGEDGQWRDYSEEQRRALVEYLKTLR